MRIVGEIPHPSCKITIFAWNNRYLIKLENGMLEQTFKINEFDVIGDAEVFQMVDETFIQEALLRFGDMSGSLHAAISRT
jgi:hypothetical protein